MGLALVTWRLIILTSRSLERKALNVSYLNGLAKILSPVLLKTALCETSGAWLTYPALARDQMPLLPAWLGISHSIASFNTARFDALYARASLITYRDDLPLNLRTEALLIKSSISLKVIHDVRRCRSNFR